MNALVHHLRFLRPLRSAMIIGLFAVGTHNWSRGHIHLDSSAAWLVTLTLVLPLMAGVLIAGATHEPLHRPFAQLLPGLRARQRLIASASVLFTALVISWSVIASPASASPFAVFGIACVLLSLPYLDQHSHLNGALSLFAMLPIYIFLANTTGAHLAAALSSAPILFLLGGITFAALCIARGFSQSSVRARVATPYRSPQTHLFSFLFAFGMSERWQAETGATRSRQSKFATTPAGDWRVRAVGPATRDWLRVFWHAQFGARAGSTFTTLQLSAAGWGIACLFCLPLIGIPLRNEPYLTSLAHFAGPVSRTTMQFMFAAVIALALLPPQLTYPISRARLGRIVFRQAVILLAMALALPVMMLLLPSLVGQAASENHLPGYGLPTLLTRALFLAILLPLIVVITIQVPKGSRLSRFIGVFTALVAGKFVESFFGNYVPTAIEVLPFILAAAVSLALLRFRLHRHYATCDLPAGPATIRST